MLFNTLTLTLLSLAASTAALPSTLPRQQCQSSRTISDPGFYAAGSIPTADFPDDPSSFENQILQFIPTFSSAASKCTLLANFERGFPVRLQGNTKPVLDVYQRRSATDRTLVGTFSNLPALEADGTLSDIVSAPLGTVACSSGTILTFEFQLKLEEAGAWASIAFEEDVSSGFDLLAC